MVSLRSKVVALLAAHALYIASGGPGRCPQVTSIKTHTLSSSAVSVVFAAGGDDVLDVYWLNDYGDEKLTGTVEGSPLERTTYPGHAFRIYTRQEKEEDRKVVHEYTVTYDDKQLVQLEVRPECETVGKQRELQAARKAQEKKDLKAKLLQRAEEFEALVHKEHCAELAEFPPCGPEGQSHLWSCIRRLSADECEARHRNQQENPEGSSFGFPNPQGDWEIGSFEDRKFDWQMPKIPRLTDGPGFLKMNLTKDIRDALLPWFKEQWAQGSAKVESPVPGGYLNDKWVKSHHVDVQWYPDVMGTVRKDMQAVLEWWTSTALKHTSSFGVRVYHRGNVLLNHVDRYDTHLASAILQVYQDVDKDGGWPVEVLSEGRDCYEVYLQPGEMLLYEGAHFKHGRPMEFRGTDFGNLFVHYAPLDWNGPGKGVKPPDAKEVAKGEL